MLALNRLYNYLPDIRIFWHLQTISDVKVLFELEADVKVEQPVVEIGDCLLA